MYASSTKIKRVWSFIFRLGNITLDIFCVPLSWTYVNVE